MNRGTKHGMVNDNKGSGRSTRVSKEDSDEKMENVISSTEKHLIDVDVSDDAGEMEQPTVTSWASDSTMSSKPQTRDIIKLDPAEAEKIDKQTVESTSINDLLRVLIKRGYDGLNPALAKGSERLLLQLNCIPTTTYRDESRGGRFGGPQGGRGGGGRGQFNNRDNGYNRQNNQNFGRGSNNGHRPYNDQGRGRGYNQRDDYNDGQRYNQRNDYNDGQYNQRSRSDNRSDVDQQGPPSGIMKTFNDRGSSFGKKSMSLSAFGPPNGGRSEYNSDDRVSHNQ